MTTRRRMVLIAIAAVDLSLIDQRASHPLATIAFFGSFAVVALSPVMLLLLTLSADDRKLGSASYVVKGDSQLARTLWRGTMVNRGTDDPEIKSSDNRPVRPP